jgi:PAS domain S-box-containing protein
MDAGRNMTVAENTQVSDKDFRDFFQKSPVGRMIVSVEPDGRLVYAEVNAAAALHFDLPLEKMVGRTPHEIFDRTVAEQVEHAFQSCIRAKRSMTLNALPRAQGGVIRLHPFILNPVLGEDGRVRFLDIIERPDSTDSGQLQRERDDAIMLLTSLFDASGLGILVTDNHGRIMRVNDTFLSDYGWTREDLLGEEFTVIIPETEQDLSRKLYRAFLERGHHGARELRILRKDGNVADIVATTAMLELSQKRRFMVSTIRDMTERKNMVRNLRRAKEEADSANRAKSSFLANMSHELRTPLNAIIGFTEIMKAQTFGPINNPKYEEYLGDVHFSARHLLEIINDVLDMSKIEAGKVDLSESEVRVSAVLESVQRIMADRASTAAVDLEFTADDSVPNVRADQRLLRQILINLVSNAIKFSPPGKKIHVLATTGADGHLRLLVQDHGCGIPADKLSHVMEPFGQVKDPRHYAGQGTGLGLPLAKAMVELHGGHLMLESQEGIGTKVWVHFPADRSLPRG